MKRSLRGLYVIRGGAAGAALVERAKKETPAPESNSAADGTLGGIVSYTVVQRIAEYGPIEWAGVIYMGAIFDVEVTT